MKEFMMRQGFGRKEQNWKDPGAMAETVPNYV